MDYISAINQRVVTIVFIYVHHNARLDLYINLSQARIKYYNYDYRAKTKVNASFKLCG